MPTPRTPHRIAAPFAAPIAALAVLATVTAVAAQESGTGPAAATASASERRFPFPPSPPERARITVDGAVHEVALDGVERRASNGARVAGTLLPTRRFALDGAFAFEFPRAWSVSGGQVEPGAAPAWWSIGTEGAFVSLRRHDGDALEARAQYRRDSSASGASDARPVELVLDGRALEGVAFEVEGGTTGHGPRYDWTHEAYAFEMDGASYLLVLMVGRRVDERPAFEFAPTIEIVPTVEPASEPGTWTAEQDAASTARFGALAPVVSSFRWADDA